MEDYYQSINQSINQSKFYIANIFGSHMESLSTNFASAPLSTAAARLAICCCTPTVQKASIFWSLSGVGLGPLLFTLYTTPLSKIISGHAIPHHRYANDSQLYVSFASGDSAAALNGLQSCLASVQSWMSTNELKLNPDKTEFLLAYWKRTTAEQNFSMSPIELSGVKTSSASASAAAILGEIFDKHFTFHSHISTVCSSWYCPVLHNHRHLDLDQNYLQLLLCPVVSIIAIHFCMVSPINKASACSESTSLQCDKVTSIYSQCSTASFSSLVVSKVYNIVQDQFVDLQNTL